MQTVKEQSNVRLKLIDPLGKGIENLNMRLKKTVKLLLKARRTLREK